MSTEISFHNTVKIEITEQNQFRPDDGREPFVSQKVVLTNNNDEELTIMFFARRKHILITPQTISDPPILKLVNEAANF